MCRHSARVQRGPERVAGPFPTWRQAFFAQCALAQQATCPIGAQRDRFTIAVDRTALFWAA